MQKVAVIIPVKGEAKVLERCLHSVCANTYPDKEIILVDDGISREALEKISALEIKILDNQSKGPSFGRNRAAQATDADLLAFTDSDCIADSHWLDELVRGFKEYPGVVACGGIQKIPSDATDFEKKVFIFMQRSGFISEYVRTLKGSKIVATSHNASCNVMYKREVFLSVGGFKVGFWPGEDVELDYRLKRKGYTIIVNPAAVVYHYRPKNLKAFTAMMYRYGLAQGFLVRQYGLFRLMHIVPLAALCVLVLVLFAIPFNFFLSLPVFLLIGYLALLLTFKSDVEIANIALCAFVYWHGGFLKGLLIDTLNTQAVSPTGHPGG